jgi:hypothetical protein
MVKAIITGRKTQTRRLVKFPKDYDGKEIYSNGIFGLKYSSSEFEGCIHRLYPKFIIGDILWVRETWQKTTWLHLSNDEYGYIYKASENGRDWEANDESWVWKPSIFMPKEACRLFLEVTDIRAERLHDITEQDAIAEGIDSEFDTYLDYEQKDTLGSCYLLSARDSYESLWAKINGQKSWDENPYVWVITFKSVECPQGFC